MKYTQVGKSDLKIPRICLGSNNFGSQVKPEVAKKILETAFDCGVNMVDTADIYTQGKSEEIIGQWAKPLRKEVILATKVGMEESSDPKRRGLCKENIEFQLRHSLERLQTDYIDLYYVHQFDDQTSLDETLETLDYFVKENVIHHIACSNFSTKQLADSLELSKDKRLESFIANQVRYNILQKDIENELLPFCKENSVGVLAYSPLRSGLLAGRYRRNSPPPQGSRGEFRGPQYLTQLKFDENTGRVEALEEIAREAALGLPQLAVAWILRNEAVSAAIVGASNPEQFKESSKAAEAKLAPDVIKRIDEI